MDVLNLTIECYPSSHRVRRHLALGLTSIRPLEDHTKKYVVGCNLSDGWSRRADKPKGGSTSLFKVLVADDHIGAVLAVAVGS